MIVQLLWNPRISSAYFKAVSLLLFESDMQVVVESWARFQSGQLETEVTAGDNLMATAEEVTTGRRSVRRFRSVDFYLAWWALDNWAGNWFPSVALDLWWGWGNVSRGVMSEGLLSGENRFRWSVDGLRCNVDGLRRSIDWLWWGRLTKLRHSVGGFLLINHCVKIYRS